MSKLQYYSYFDTVVNQFLIERGVLDMHKGEVVGLVVDSGSSYFSPIAFPDTVHVGIRVAKLGWWRGVAIPLVCVGVVVGNTLLGVFRAFELGIGEATLDRLHTDGGWRSGLILNGLACGMLLGCAIGIGLLSVAYDPAAWNGLAHSRQRIHFALFMLVLIGVNGLAWALRARQLAQRRRATEAQLHLLQAQIEPQFLFNTLADVQGLLDHDPERARQMLEEFADYLRASLGQLRRADSNLAAELDMAQCYLKLLRLRMGELLRFSIDASVQARCGDAAAAVAAAR